MNKSDKKGPGAAAPPKGHECSLRLFVSVLGMRDPEGGRGWAAVALEMDLWGHGKNFEEACEDLRDLLQMHVTFAIGKNQREMIYRPADPRFFAIFHQVHADDLRGLPSTGAMAKYEARGLALPDPRTVSQPQYALANA